MSPHDGAGPVTARDAGHAHVDDVAQAQRLLGDHRGDATNFALQVGRRTEHEA